MGGGNQLLWGTDIIPLLKLQVGGFQPSAISWRNNAIVPGPDNVPRGKCGGQSAVAKGSAPSPTCNPASTLHFTLVGKGC